MLVQCTNKKCLRQWNYNGKAEGKGLIHCSKCGFKSMLDKAIININPPTQSTHLQIEKKQYAEYENPLCKVTDSLGKEFEFPNPVLKDGELQ